MLSVHLLLVCVAVAVAVPLPSGKPAPPTEPPTKPPCKVLIISNLTQVGITKGGAAVSSTGSTQGSGSLKCIIATPTSVEKIAAVGNSAVSGAGASSNNGIFKHNVVSGSVVGTTKDGLKAKSGTKGTGASAGGAGILQNAGANGGTTLSIAQIAAVLTGGKNLVKIKQTKKGTATSSSGHKASGTGNSIFDFENRGGTEIKLDDIKLIVPEIPTPAPIPTTTTKAPKIKGKKHSG